MNKTHVQGMQNFCSLPHFYSLKDYCQKTHDNHTWKISNFFKLIFFNDFHWFSMTFPGKMSFFQANIKFHDFSRQDWNSMTFPGLYEPCIWCSGFPQTSLEKFQWFFNDVSRQKSQISMIILNVTKWKNTGPHVTHGPLTLLSHGHYMAFLRKYVKSSYLIWWITYQLIMYM